MQLAVITDTGSTEIFAFHMKMLCCQYVWLFIVLISMKTALSVVFFTKLK